ncbi:MAG: hypothetical protein M1128_01855 [Candidatus Marsarchaeota archaeon]|nr:hypothetical protein [Candidatus Marsarchaeota archaeon]
MKNSSDLLEVVKALNNDPNKSNWEAISSCIKRSNASYYKVIYPKKIKEKQDLKSAYVILYDSKFKIIGKIPILSKSNRETRGMLFYLRGLSLNRKV